MSPIFHARMDILPEPQRRIWPGLQPTRELGFVLYGGTAIALRLGHRTSVDFDFFTEQTLNRTALVHGMPFLAAAPLLQDESQALTFLVAENASAQVKISFFGGIDFGRVGEPDLTSDGVALVASLDDLMATKLKVILQRAEAKDYRDIAAMIRTGVSLDKGLATARALFGPNFQPSECLRALVFFNDGDLRELSVDEKHILVTAASLIRNVPTTPIFSNRLTTNNHYG